MTLQHDLDAAPILKEFELEDVPDGPAAASMIAAGFGIFVMGLFTVLSEVSEPIHDFLEALAFGKPVGPLAGKTILGVVAYFGLWAVLGVMWKHRDVDIKRMFWIGLVLGLLGALMMFPPIFTAFA